MKKLTVLFLTLTLCGTILAGCGSSKSDNAAETDTTETAGADTSADNASDKKEGSDESASAEEELLTGLHHITIDVQDYGTITLELDADEAPISVTNFVNLAEEGFYDGLTFHRIISGFMIQGGGFNEQMQQKQPNPPIKNEADNGLLNKRGTISMARTADKDSATSQFFLNVADNAFLDHGQRDFGYAVFGKIVKGMDVADKISQVPTHDVGPYQNVPSKPVVILSAKVLP